VVKGIRLTSALQEGEGMRKKRKKNDVILKVITQKKSPLLLRRGLGEVKLSIFFLRAVLPLPNSPLAKERD
jgi:hypothetical protein